MTISPPPASPTPWHRIARDHGREWFRDNPGAPWEDFYRWVAEEWEPQEFLRAGFGWRPGQPVNAAALTDAHLGLAEAVEGEWRIRQSGNMPRPGHVGSLGRTTAPSAGIEAEPWWRRLQRDGAA